MKKPVEQIVAEKRKWHYQPTADEEARGFKGWYSRGYLPHFDAPGVWQFITYRLGDSVPIEQLQEWCEILGLKDKREKFRQIERFLDRCLGACHLRDPRIAEIVQGNLWFHDGRSYRLLAWVIMPNHVHILAEMWQPLGVVLKQWKSYTANAANRLLGCVGEPFWQAGYYDRYIRDQEHYRRVVRYIENNPVKAKLVRTPEEWLWSSARYRGPYASDELPRIPQNPSECGPPGPRRIESDASKKDNADKAVRTPNEGEL
jgi:REP element-mobilizing transposase RayT